MSERDWESAYLQEISYADGLERRALAAEAERDSQAKLIARLVEALKGNSTWSQAQEAIAEAQALTEKQAN